VPIALASGNGKREAVSATRELVIPDLLRVRVTPGVTDRDPKAAVQEAADTYQSFLDRARAENLAHARELHRQWRDKQDRLGVDQEQLSQAMGDRLLDELGVEVARLSARTEAYGRGRPAEPDLPLDIETARTADEAAREAATEAREHAEQARQLHDERQSDLATRREDALVWSTRQKTLADELEGLRKQLDEVRAESPDHAVKQAMERYVQDALLAEQKLAQQEALLAGQDPGTLRVTLTNARERRRRLGEDYERYQAELTRLAGRLELAGSEGRQDRLDRALIALDEGERQQASLQARAEAASLLYQTMTRHREDAKLAYVAPFQTQLERLGRIVFGPDLQLTVDSDLRIVSRTLDGVTVPYDELSTGAREQLCIIARLACATLVDPAEGVPVIIDDALGHSDPHRLERMGAVFAATSGDSQAIVLTCMPERYRGIGSAKVVRLADGSGISRPDRFSPPPTTDLEPSVPAPSPHQSPLECILDTLRAAGRALGKAEILERTGLPPEVWGPTIKALQEDRKVHRIGERRGATYLPVG
jgi:hypothetical protein